MAGQTLSDTARCFGLVLLSLSLLPLSVLVSILQRFAWKARRDHELRTRPNITLEDASRSRTVLVTGVGMAKGLTLARAFHLSGHRVVGADFEDNMIPCSGRWSQSLTCFYRLPRLDQDSGATGYINSLVEVVEVERVDLWVSCSGVASAVEDAEAKEVIERKTSCRCIQFDIPTTSTLHEKDSFMRACRERGLPVPETHDIEEADDALYVLASNATSNPQRKFILKPIGMDDANRGNMTLLPFSSEVKTKDHVSHLPISPHNPWILQQFIPGGEEYCTHALVVGGDIKCFVACPSSELLMHYQALPRDSALWRAMLDFTVKFVKRSRNPESMTGHLSFDFMVEDASVQEDGFERKMYAIECNPRAHTAVALFAQRGPEMKAMVEAYLSALEPSGEDTHAGPRGANGSELRNGIGKPIVIPPVDVLPRYWIGHDLVCLLVHPLLRLSAGSADPREVSTAALDFLSHLLAWKEGTLEAWDPMPALVLYHVHWPLTVMSAWWHGRRWSRVNVSTTKMFAC